MEVKMRAYFFQNFYLQGIHAGIQSAHTLAEMSLLDWDAEIYEVYRVWAASHKTIIVLNGGTQVDLEEIYSLCAKMRLPYAKFHEEHGALNGALTNVGIILPEVIYNSPPIDSLGYDLYIEQNGLTGSDHNFIVMMQSKRLMN